MNQRLFVLETSTMTKAELSAALCQQLGLNKREAREFVDAFFEELFQKLAQDGKCWEPAEREYKMPKYANWPGYEAGMPLVARRYCGLWGRGS